MPVIQGYEVSDYITHAKNYLKIVEPNAWIGVGSICKRNTRPEIIYKILSSILDIAPEFKLHGFGVKITSLTDKRISSILHTADSMSWSFAARWAGKNPNDWREAESFANKINELIKQ
jgi:hypothetical protein